MQLLFREPGRYVRPGLLFLFFYWGLTPQGWGQMVSLSVKDAPLATVLPSLERQAAVEFVYTTSVLDQSKPVTADLRQVPLDSALVIVFRGQPLGYTRNGRFIVLTAKAATPVPRHLVTGRLTDEQEQPVVGATLTARSSGLSVITDPKGRFSLTVDRLPVTLVVSGAEIHTVEAVASSTSPLAIVVQQRVGSLDETVVMGYGKTTRRRATGNIARVTKETIQQQPVSNVLTALQGRVAGLEITQSNGLAGSAVKVQVRGRNSIAQGSQPLFILDGVPLAAGNSILNQLSSALGNPSTAPDLAGGLSPLVTLNPADIESIEVLKDADATAIYGSRGANGVILITTRKGQNGQLRTNLSYSAGWSRITRGMDFLTTPQYLAMRREGFVNDNATPTNSNAPDLLLWDTTRYTDFKDLLIGNTARMSDVQASISGGSSTTQFLLGTGYHDEGTVFPGAMYLRRGSANLNVQHRSPDQRFTAQISINYGSVKNNYAVNDLTGYLNLPPNTPALFKDNGELNWQENGVNFTNPLAFTKTSYLAQSDNFNSHLQLQYRLVPGLTAKISAGYNTTRSDEEQLNPIAATNPALNRRGLVQFGNRSLRSWVLEPQLEYTTQHAWGRLTAFVGGTWQSTNQAQHFQQGSGIANDALLRSINQATSIDVSNAYTDYRYAAFFGRVQYNWHDEYLVTLSGRRDGSSRFGPANRFANFGAVGLGWLFSNTFKDALSSSILSFGKLRASFGTTGNDQITDYQYLATWTGTPFPYAGTAGLMPTRLYNPHQQWEVNRKWEGALELGFWQDRLLVSIAYFRNRSRNQLVDYPLPGQSGFSGLTKNLAAIVQNSGLELELRSTNVSSGRFRWSSFGNLTIPRNRLVSFPGLAISSYANDYVTGYSLSVLKRYQYLGVDTATGLYTFDDVNRDGQLTLADLQLSGDLDADFYGGLGNEFSLGGISCTIFFEFRQQTGRNYLSELSGNRLPGRNTNQPVIVLERWQHPGDVAPVQRFGALAGTPAVNAANRLLSSEAIYTDASYLRLKNISLSYSLPPTWLRTIRASSARLYVQAQNVLTITGYRGADPETQQFYRLPPLKTLAAGLSLTF